MKISAITKLKSGVILEALTRAGWTQSKLARRAHLHVGTLGDIINLVKKPTEEQAIKIQLAFGEVGILVEMDWPEEFKGFKKPPTLVQTQDISPAALISSEAVKRLTFEDPLKELIDKEVGEQLAEDVKKLNKLEQAAIRTVVDDGVTFEQAARDFTTKRKSKRKISRQCVHQAVGNALRSLERRQRARQDLENRPTYNKAWGPFAINDANRAAYARAMEESEAREEDPIEAGEEETTEEFQDSD